MKLIPVNDCVLVELADSLEYIDVPDKPYSTRTSGIVVAVDENLSATFGTPELIGKKVYFKDFEDGTKVEENGRTYAFIKYEEIRGYHD